MSCPPATKKVAIAIDDWKLPIFERHLRQSGYRFKNFGLFSAGVLVLQVETVNVVALAEVIKAANAEAGGRIGDA